MDRITKALRVLALAVAAAGIVCLYLIHRPSDLASAWAATWQLAPWYDPWVFSSALAALAAAAGARLAEWVPPLRRRDPDVHELPLELADAEPQPVVIERQRTHDAAARLERHLRGRRPDVPAFVDEMLGAAVAAGASDVHVRPTDVDTRVAWRVGGELSDVVTAPAEHHEPIVRRLKILAQLKTYQTDMPQDGRFGLKGTDDGGGSADVDVRMSVLPTRHGEKVVLRLARKGRELRTLDDLGMPEAVLEPWRELLSRPQGLVILTGPTGCGKTTTLYASLAHVQETRGQLTAIATLEDPVEIDLPYLSQTQIDRAAGLSFAASLRAVLRQDPDVLMIGEIRDAETAHIAVEAGLTGHLILTTLHADSSAGVFHRLIEMGVEPFVASSSVLAVVSQRLARRLCPECRRPAPPGRAMEKRLLGHGITRTAVENLSYYRAPGCAACGERGLAGRAAVFEFLRVTPELRELVARKASTREIAEAAQAAGMTPLLKAALLEAVAGTISLEEALRVAG